MTTQGFSRSGFLHQPAGKIPAHDEVVDMHQKLFDTWIELIEIGDHGYSGLRAQRAARVAASVS